MPIAWMLVSVRATLFPQQDPFGLDGPDLWETALPAIGKRQSNRQLGPIPQRIEAGVDDGRFVVIQVTPQRADILISRDMTSSPPEGIPTLADAAAAFDAVTGISIKIAHGLDRVLSRLAVATEAVQGFTDAALAVAALSTIHPGLPITADNMDVDFMRSFRTRLDNGTEANLIERWKSARVQTVMVQIPPQVGSVNNSGSPYHILQFDLEVNTPQETVLSLHPQDATSVIRAMTDRVRSSIGTPC